MAGAQAMPGSYKPSGADPSDRVKVHGRRKGHPLRQHQTQLVAALLPQLRIDTNAPFPGIGALFPVPVDDLWLEIGFGGAEHLLWQAQQHPRTGLIGCEPFINGVAKALNGIDALGLNNVRLHDDDARALLAWLPDASVGRLFLLFPDPWPKKRHWKRRFINHDNLDQFARVMKPGAELRIGSDIPDHTDWILRHLMARGEFRWTAQEPAGWRIRPMDWPATRYEEKAVREGRRPAYLTFVRT